MTEKSAESMPSTIDKTSPSGDTTNVLTALSSNDGTLSLTVNIDKSTAKKWGVGLIVFASSAMLVLAAVLFFLGMNYAALNEATKVASREGRLTQQALDDKRLENRQAWKALGIDGIALEDHDISDLIEELKKKHPAKED
jgi:hypothetical protein